MFTISFSLSQFSRREGRIAENCFSDKTSTGQHFGCQGQLHVMETEKIQESVQYIRLKEQRSTGKKTECTGNSKTSSNQGTVSITVQKDLRN